MSKTIKQIIQETDELISFPEVVSKFNDAVNDGSSDADKLGLIIQQDPILTAKLLQLANSAFFGAAVPVTSVNDAIVRIGTMQTRDLVYCISAKSAFDGIPMDLIAPEDYWKHSLLCAVSARVLAKKLKIFPAETLFTAGLLHDIGQLVLFSQEPDLSIKALELNIDEYDGLDSVQSEQKVFGFDHAEVGKELAIKWGLPDLIQECIAFHHKPEDTLDNAKHVAALHIANSIAVLAEIESDDLSDGPIIDDIAWEIVKAESSVIQDCIPVVTEEYSEMVKILFSNVKEAA